MQCLLKLRRTFTRLSCTHVQYTIISCDTVGTTTTIITTTTTTATTWTCRATTTTATTATRLWSQWADGGGSEWLTPFFREHFNHYLSTWLKLSTPIEKLRSINLFRSTYFILNENLLKTILLEILPIGTVCPRSLDPFYKANY